MKLSTKQLAFSWINSCLKPEKINVERNDFLKHQEAPLTDKQLEDVTQFINKELAKVKVKYQTYIDKYCT